LRSCVFFLLCFALRSVVRGNRGYTLGRFGKSYREEIRGMARYDPKSLPWLVWCLLWIPISLWISIWLAWCLLLDLIFILLWPIIVPIFGQKFYRRIAHFFADTTWGVMTRGCNSYAGWDFHFSGEFLALVSCLRCSSPAK
jgi:hypothetical protein